MTSDETLILMLQLTKPGIEHVERHLVTFLSTRDGHETLVAVVLRFVDLDDTATQCTDLINLRTALANDRANHIVRNEYLLGHGLPGYHSLHRLCGRTRVAGRLRGVMSTVWLRLMRAGAGVALPGRARSIVQRRLRMLLRSLTVQVRHAVRVRRSTVSLIGVLPVIVWMTPLTTSSLRNIWHHLHSSRDGASGPTGPRCVRRGGWATESLGELLYEGTAHIIGGDVDCVGHSQYHQGALCRQRKARVGRVQSRSGGFLNLADPHARLSDDGANQDVWYEETQWVRLGLGVRRRFEWLVIQSPDDQAESLWFQLDRVVACDVGRLPSRQRQPSH